MSLVNVNRDCTLPKDIVHCSWTIDISIGTLRSNDPIDFCYTTGKPKISTAGGGQPRWRADGKEIFYVAADGKMTAVSVKSIPGSSFSPGLPEPLFDSHVSTPTTELTLLQYDVTADGKRFLVVTTGLVGSPSAPLTVVVNWNAGH